MVNLCDKTSFGGFLRHSPDMLCAIDENGRIVKVSDSCEQILGYAASELEESPYIDFVIPDDREPTLQTVQNILQGNSVTDFKNKYRDKHGKIVYLSWSAAWCAENRLMYCIARALKGKRDIPPVENSYERLESRAQELNAILESISDAFFTLDKDWRFTYVNSIFAEHEGYSKETLTGNNIWEVFPRLISTEFYRKCMEAAQSGLPDRFEESYAHSGVTYRFKLYPSAEGLSVFFTDITQERKMQQELEKLSLVASKTNNGVIIADREWRIEWVNEGFTRLFGYSLEEAVGERPADLLHSPKTDKAGYEPLEEKVLRGESISFEVLKVKKGGEEVWVNVDISAVFGEEGEALRYVVVQTDITALKKSEQELEKLALVARYTDNSVFIADAQRRTEWVNEAFTKSTGYTLAEIVGKDPKDVLGGPETDPQTAEAILENLERGQAFSVDIVNYKKSGEKFWVAIDISPVYGKDGKLKRYIAIHRDITSKKEAEANLLKMTEDLYVQNSNLQQFTYIVSHNLRAPLANALGLANLLTRLEKSSPSFDLSLSNLRKTLVRMDTVLRDVNTMLAARERQRVLEIEKVELMEVIRQALSYLQEPLNTLGASVAIDVEMGTRVNANKAYLFSVFYNLMTNAIRFRSPERPLRIEIGHCAGTDGSAVVSFSDNGTGFDQERAGDNIFRFYKTFHRNGGGRGTGLFLVKTYLEAMGGRVEVESQEDVGTRFTICLP